MSEENKVIWFFVKFFVVILIIGGLASVASRVLGLAWFPWEIKQQTQMIRNSNGYITTQQTQLRQLYSAYSDTDVPAQKAAIVKQMQEVADLIPQDVQPDIRSFLNR